MYSGTLLLKCPEESASGGRQISEFEFSLVCRLSPGDPLLKKNKK